ncbi:MAG: hypothetical protein ABI904_15685 [Chloroflexota bacterium]
MNKLEAISVKLLPEEIGVLKKYSKDAIEKGRQHFFWEKIDEQLASDYPALKALDALGFVKIEMEEKSKGTIYDSYYLTLYTSAIQRAEYEGSSYFRKRLTRFFLSYKDWMAVWGFVISVGLAIIKFLEYFFGR